MDNKTLYILRGVSGSGKTTLAKTLEATLPDAVSIAADDFWYILGDGVYAFDIKRLGEAHLWCKDHVGICMKVSQQNIIVHNTNTSEKEITPYLNLAEVYNYKVVSLVVENRHGNKDVHNVPKEVLVNQKKRLISNIKL